MIKKAFFYANNGPLLGFSAFFYATNFHSAFNLVKTPLSYNYGNRKPHGIESCRTS